MLNLLRFHGKNIKIGRNSSVAFKAILVAGEGEIVLGNACRIASFSVLDTQNGKIELGDRVGINSHCVLFGRSGITIGDHSLIASHVTIVSSDHNYSDRSQLIRDQGIADHGTIIGKDAWIGTGAKILAGSKIGDGCVIGANAVVKGVLDDYGVYAGIPAKKIRSRN